VRTSACRLAIRRFFTDISTLMSSSSDLSLCLFGDSRVLPDVSLPSVAVAPPQAADKCSLPDQCSNWNAMPNLRMPNILFPDCKPPYAVSNLQITQIDHPNLVDIWLKAKLND